MRALFPASLLAASFWMLPAHGQSPDGIHFPDGSQITVLDGATVDMPCNFPSPLCAERVRLYAVDAPDAVHPHCRAEAAIASAAKERLKELLRGQPVTIERGEPATGRRIDRFHRTLGALVTPGGDVASVLLKEGYVLPARRGRAGKRDHSQFWCGGR